jgi:hypothetical protein
MKLSNDSTRLVHPVLPDSDTQDAPTYMPGDCMSPQPIARSASYLAPLERFGCVVVVCLALGWACAHRGDGDRKQPFHRDDLEVEMRMTERDQADLLKWAEARR